MNKIIIDLKYGCYPVWLYGENGELIINDLPWELSQEWDIDGSFAEIQDIYDSLFDGSNGKPEYIGFQDQAEKERFVEMIDNAIILIKMKTGSIYSIEKKFEVEKL